MDENEVLDQELDTTESTAEDATVDTEIEGDLEYDDEGNIILPDEESETEEVGDGADEEYIDISNESDEAIATEEQQAEAEEPSKEGTEAEATVEPTELEKENEALKKELERIKSQSKETLEKLGVKADDELEGLMELAAQADDKTIEDYKKEREDRILVEEARKLKEATEFEQVLAKDLSEIQAIYPDAMKYKSIKDFPKDVLQKFARYRNMGVPATDAYAASNADGIRQYAVNAAKAKATNDNKSHLRTNVPVGSKNRLPHMPKEDLIMWRDLFPDKSDREIVKLYARSLKK